MVKAIGIMIIATGIVGIINDWIIRSHNRQKRLEELLSFYRKAVYAMEETHMHSIAFLENYESEDPEMSQSMQEVADRLKEKCYPRGELAWQEVMMQRREKWDLSKEAARLLYRSGTAFFGKSRAENTELLHLYIRQLESCIEKEKKMFGEQKKVWIPVGSLGALMVVIILI